MNAQFLLEATKTCECLGTKIEIEGHWSKLTGKCCTCKAPANMRYLKNVAECSAPSYYLVTVTGREMKMEAKFPPQARAR